MEKAILKTLIYSDLFDYPLKAYEIHKWLIGEKVALVDLDKTLRMLIAKKKIKAKHGLYFLKGRDVIFSRRIKNLAHSRKLLKKASFVSGLLKIIPWIRLLGVSGGLALDNASKSDDIDLFIITSRSRLWLTRLLVGLTLEALGLRRKYSDKRQDSSGKFCVNMLITEDRLVQSDQDIFIAHEILQLKVLFARGGTYQKFLDDNAWVFEYLPNWIGHLDPQSLKPGRKKLFFQKLVNPLLGKIEDIVKSWQLKIMKPIKGAEIIEDDRLLFHPNNTHFEVLKQYSRRVAKFRLNS